MYTVYTNEGRRTPEANNKTTSAVHQSFTSASTDEISVRTTASGLAVKLHRAAEFQTAYKKQTGSV